MTGLNSENKANLKKTHFSPTTSALKAQLNFMPETSTSSPQDEQEGQGMGLWSVLNVSSLLLLRGHCLPP